MKRDYLLDLMRARATVFTSNDVALLWEAPDVQFVRKKLYRYVKAGKLYAIRRGIYSKDEEYSKLELATKIFTPAYVSFETVLAKAGVVFQFYSQIFVASYLTREIAVSGQTYVFKRIRESILTSRTGIEQKDNCFIATPERAFLDVLYLNKDYHFDNLGTLKWDKVESILPIYGNQRMAARVKAYRQASEKA